MNDTEKLLVNRFDSAFRGLLRVCIDVFGKKDEDKLDLTPNSKSHQYQKWVNKYLRCYNRTVREDIKGDHMDLFQIIYKAFHKYILNDGHINDRWLLLGKINVIYGSNFGNPKDIIVPLSKAYNLALIKKHEIESLGNVDKNDETQDYPDLILYYLYQIFTCLELSQEERAQLNSIVVELETELDIDPEDITESKSNGEFGGLVNIASSIMKSTGMAPPPGSEVKEQELGDAIGKVFSNENTTKAIGSMFQGLGDCKDIGSVINHLVTGFNNPELTKAIGNTLQETASSAAQMPNENQSIQQISSPLQN